MKIEITQKDYFRELKLIKKQNATEIDMYPWIYMLLQMAECKKSEIKKYTKVSIRDVHKRFKSLRGQILYGLSSVPDFIIADQTFDNSKNNDGKIDNINQIYGCVEIKRNNEILLDIKSIFNELKITGTLQGTNNEKAAKGQLLGHMLWYKKVLYTNGIKWQYLEWKPTNEEYDEIKNIVKKKNQVQRKLLFGIMF